MTSFKTKLLSVTLGLMAAAAMMVPGQEANAADAPEINREVQETLAKFYKEVDGSKELISKSQGVLVFPDVYQAGLGIGGEYGEGALLVNGKVENYYNLIEASYGFQLGAQEKSVILVFTESDELNEFRNTQNWEIGADASVAVLKLGAEGSINSKTTNQPVVGFVIDQKGLMYEATLNGAKITKINK